MYKVAFIADGKTEIITEIDPWGESEHMSGLAAQALKYIRDHSAESISLSDVADSVYVSRWHMSRIIHNEILSFKPFVLVTTVKALKTA